MGRITFVTVLTLMSLQWTDSATPVPNGKQYVYSYTGIVTAANSATDAHMAQWSFNAKLVMQSTGNDIVMRFKDIKTSLFNGAVQQLEHIEAKSPAEEAQHLSLPFVVHYHSNGSAASLSYQPDDPLWSVNMKRAIGSIVQIDAVHTASLHEHKFYEQSIYGSCEAEYSVTEQDSIQSVSKTINDDSCVNHLESSWSNCPPAPVMPQDFNPTSTVVVRTYQFLRKDNDYVLKSISSVSNITYQTMNCEPSSQELYQRQTFHLENESDVTHPIDVTKATESTSLEYVFDENDGTSGRKPKKTVEIASILQQFKEFKTEFHKYPLVPGDLGINNTLMAIFDTLHEMRTLDLTALGELFSEDSEIETFFLSMLPYIGSKETIKLIKAVIQNRQSNVLLVMRLLATFPKYVNEYTPELLESMDSMMNLNTTNRQVRYAGILSFAAMVAEANTRTEIPVKQLEKYYTKYNDNFKDSKNYEDKMVYLLGLINMGNLLHPDTIITIITNQKESHHIRSLAAYGFQPFMSSNPEKMFAKLWPIVANQREHFEVRVAVLDLLMSSDLSQGEFDMILEEFKRETHDSTEQHLQNYLSTTLRSISNETLYFDYLGAKAAEVWPSAPIPSYYTAWASGNYRLSYTDAMPNFGKYVQTRSVANPHTNIPNVVQLSYNNFAMSMNLGTYTAYIKLDGVASTLFENIYLKIHPNGTNSFPRVVEMLEKLNCKLVKDADIHIEIVLFWDNRVVYAMHLDMEKVNEYKQTSVFEELLHLLVEFESVSYPKMYMGNMRSDLGTPVNTYHTETTIVSHELKTEMEKLLEAGEIKAVEWNYRSSSYQTVVLQSYNPLVDVNIAVYKFRSTGQRVHLPIKANITGEYLIFDNENDNFNLVIDRSLGTTVDDEEKLHEYCSSCETNVEPFPIQEESVQYLREAGIRFNVTEYNGSTSPDFTDALRSYKGNTQTVPLVGPILFFFYQLEFFGLLGHDAARMSVRTERATEDATEDLLEMIFDVDDIYTENDPINGTDLRVGIKISSRRKHDAKTLSTMIFNYAYVDSSESADQNTASYVKYNHTLRAQYTDDENRYMMCFDREFKYPSRRSDVWSITPVEPAGGTARFAVGSTDETYSCPTEYSITFDDIFEPAKDQMDKVRTMDEYTECMRDASGFKYIPPTAACVAVHQAVSKYNNYTLYVDVKNAGSKQDETQHTRLKLLEYNYVYGDVADVRLSRILLYVLSLYKAADLEDLLDFQTSLGLFHGSDDPTAVAYNDYDRVIGVSSLCDLTANKIITPLGKDIENYKAKDSEEVVAYVERFNATRGGLTVQKYSAQKIGFTMWSGHDKLVASISDNKLSVVLNDKAIHSQNADNEDFRVYFLEDDVLYITNQIVEVYYNTEYIAIKTPSLYNKYLCGLCAHENGH